MNSRKTLKSGKVLTLQIASFAVASKLRQAVAIELKGVNLGETFKIAAGASATDLGGMDLPVDALKNLVCQFLASEAVERAVFECMKVCQYQGERIGQDTFEPEDAREDFLPVAWEVMVMNLAPFFKGLDWRSLINAPPSTSSPAS